MCDSASWTATAQPWVVSAGLMSCARPVGRCTQQHFPASPWTVPHFTLYTSHQHHAYWSRQLTTPHRTLCAAQLSASCSVVHPRQSCRYRSQCCNYQSQCWPVPLLSKPVLLIKATCYNLPALIALLVCIYHAHILYITFLPITSSTASTSSTAATSSTSSVMSSPPTTRRFLLAVTKHPAFTVIRSHERPKRFEYIRREPSSTEARKQSATMAAPASTL